MNKILHGDCLEQLRLLPDNSVDSVVTDPPSGIGFMGKDWDSDKGGRKQWIEWLCGVFVEVRRVLKPGGHCLVWALPRTSHWTGTALEDAGFEVRDVVHHIFGSGFPKSHNISKTIDKAAGAVREVVGMKRAAIGLPGASVPEEMKHIPITAPSTPSAIEWEGWGTALKPAVECWWLVRKPLSENTVAENVLKWGTGGLNIDQCRVEGGARPLIQNAGKPDPRGDGFGGKFGSSCEGTTALGRFPANLILDGSDEVVAQFPQTTSGGGIKGNRPDYKSEFLDFQTSRKFRPVGIGGDSGSASRFFYCAKPSQAERNKGCEELEEKEVKGNGKGSLSVHGQTGKPNSPIYSKNIHPTIKSLSLMRYLIKLITPRNGTVLDMFAGSGTTLIAAKQLGMNYIGIEQNEEYIKIAEARIKAWDVLEPTQEQEPFPDCIQTIQNDNIKPILIQQNLF